MIKSMTGYGTASIQADGGRSYTVEVKSVNHRFCDIHVKTPGKLSFLEPELKKVVKQRFQRGRFDIYLSFDEYGVESKQVSFNTELAAEYLRKFRELGDVLQLDASLDLLSLTRFPDVLKIEQTELDLDDVVSSAQQALQDALDHLEQMRQHEGQLLEEDITGYLRQIRDITTAIVQIADTSPAQYKAALEERIKRLTENSIEINEDRIAQEVVMFADRCDISEEVTRLYAHLDHFDHLLNDEEAVGRKLDFMVQEMNREINTIGSKANNAEIAKHVIEVKSILEKIREQIQNVE